MQKLRTAFFFGCILLMPYVAAFAQSVPGGDEYPPYSFERFNERVGELKKTSPFECNRLEVLSNHAMRVHTFELTFTAEEITIQDLEKHLRYIDMGWTGVVSRIEVVEGAQVKAAMDNSSGDPRFDFVQREYRDRVTDILLCLNLISPPGTI